MKALAVSSAKRSQAAPDVPTVAEAAGLKGFDITLWQGFFAPRGTPKEIVERLNREVNRIVMQPDVRERLLREGADVMNLSVAEFTAFVGSEAAKYASIIKATGIKAD